MGLIHRWIEVWGPFPKAFYAEEGYPNEYYTSASFGQTHSTHSWGWSSGVRHGMVEAIWNVVKTTGGCASISDRERVEALKLALILTRYVQNVRDRQNGVHPKYVWLIQAGNWLPEIREVAEMSDNAPWALMSFMDDCHYPDGAYNELCYHRHSRFAEAAREAAAQGKDMGGYLEKFRKCFDFNIWFTKPMGNFPRINDQGHGERFDPEEPAARFGGYIQMACELYPDDPHLQYIHTRGAEGRPPPELSRNFPWSGFMVMRTGWQPDDLHLIFDGGRNTSSHNHMDQMNVVLTAYGSTLLCDAGYVGTGFGAADRKYYISHPRSHNLLMVDDLAQIPDTPDGDGLIGWRAFGNTPVDNRWLTTEGYDYAETCYDRRYRQDYESADAHVAPAAQERRVLFLKPATGTPYWLVWDIVRPRDGRAGDHDLQLLFHFTPTSSARVLEEQQAVVNAAENAELLILPRSDRPWRATIVKGDARPEANYWQGFVSGGFGNPLVPTECAVFGHNGPLPAGVATVLFPYRKGKTPEVSARLLPGSANAPSLATDRGFAMEITLPDGRDMVLAQGQPGTLREFDGFACDARLAAVRYDRSGEPMGVLMVEGSTLRIDGDQVLNVQRPDTSCVVLGREQTVPSDDVIVNMDGLSVIDVQ
ncbi:MAG: heparinase II/III family protein, partial [Candidatus Latescibacteria bacterium]|nr:heparinase II/III family protein [Candidatus Latescibacterota bacterium]